MKNWAEKEVELACKHAAKTGRKEGEFEYNRACYKSALKAYNSLIEDGHSAASIQFTKDILNRLIDGKPIIPIEDTDDIWLNGFDCGDYVSYQCSRMSSLFKKVYNDGHVEYEDISRIVCVDGKGLTYHNYFVRKIITELAGPVTMPYEPSTNPIRVYTSEYLYDKKYCDFDILAIWRYIMPNGDEIPVHRFFKEVDRGWEEISLKEFKEILPEINKNSKEAIQEKCEKVALEIIENARKDTQEKSKEEKSIMTEETKKDIQEKYEKAALKINENVRKDIQNNLADIFVDSIQNLQKNLSECDFISNTAGTIRLSKNKK